MNKRLRTSWPNMTKGKRRGRFLLTVSDLGQLFIKINAKIFDIFLPLFIILCCIQIEICLKAVLKKSWKELKINDGKTRVSTWFLEPKLTILAFYFLLLYCYLFSYQKCLLFLITSKWTLKGFHFQLKVSWNLPGRGNEG